MKTLCIFLLLSCQTAPTPSESSANTPAHTIEQMEIAVFQDRREKEGDSILVVDVRTPGEYQSGHVPGAKSIPLGDLENRIDEVTTHKSKPIHLICASGGRSQQAATLLLSKGFEQAINIVGGTNAYKKAGHALEK